MKKTLFILAASSFVAATSAQAQLSLTALNSPRVVTFDSTLAGVSNGQFSGSGFQATPSTGQLDSDAWAATGWSDGDLGFAGSRTTGDYARGSTSSTAITTGGFYAFGTTNRSLLVQPGGSDFAPGTLTLRVQNNTGDAVSAFSLSYSLAVRNDQNRSSSFNFSYSTDDSNYVTTSLTNPLFTYTSPAPSDSNGMVAIGSPSATVSASVADGGYLYLRWSSNDVAGSGSRDEFSLDNISVTAVPEPHEYALGIAGLVMLIVIARRRRMLA